MLARRQRVNLNLLVDHNQAAFLAHCSQFVQEVHYQSVYGRREIQPYWAGAGRQGEFWTFAKAFLNFFFLQVMSLQEFYPAGVLPANQPQVGLNILF